MGIRLSTKVAYNTIVQTVSKIMITVLGLIAVAVMTRTLGKYGFGQYTTIMAFLTFFGVLSDLGLTLVTTRMIAEPGANKEKIVANLFTLRFFSALFFLGLAPLIVFFFPYSATVKIGVSITTLSFFFIALNQIFVGIFQNKLRMDKVSIAEVSGRLFLVFGVIAAAALNMGVLGMALATVLASAVNFLLHFLFAARYVKIRFEFDISLWKQVVKRSWPLALTIVFNLIYLKADTLVLSLVKPQDEVGLYGATYKVIDVLSTLPFMFAGLVLPILSRSWSKGDKAFFGRVAKRSLDLMLILAIPLVVGTQFLANDIMLIIAGEEFLASGGILKILITAVAAIFIGCLLSHIIIAIDKQKEIIWAYIFTAITSLVGYLIFIPMFSYYGAAAMTIYSEVVIALFAGFYVWKHTRIIPGGRTLVKAVAASGFMALFLYLFGMLSFSGRPLELALGFLGGSAVYFLSLYAFGGINKEDVLSLLNRKNEKNIIT